MSAGGGGGGGGGGKTIGDVVGERLLSMLEQKEEELDMQLQQIDNLEEDEVERMRAQRLEVLKRNQKQKAEWLSHGHGEYREVEDQCVCVPRPTARPPPAAAPSPHTPTPPPSPLTPRPPPLAAQEAVF